MRDWRDELSSDCLPDVEHNDEYNRRGKLEPPPRTLLTSPVILTVANHGALSFLGLCNWIFLRLVYTRPIRLGASGFDPTRMGICLGVWGVLRGVLQLTIFNRNLNFLGLGLTFVTLISGLVSSNLLFAAINGNYAQYGGTELVLRVFVLIQMLCTIGVMQYGTQRPFIRA